MLKLFVQLLEWYKQSLRRMPMPTVIMMDSSLVFIKLVSVKNDLKQYNNLQLSKHKLYQIKYNEVDDINFDSIIWCACSNFSLL